MSQNRFLARTLLIPTATLCALLACWQEAAVTQERGAARVVVPDCLVKPLDEVRLSSERGGILSALLVREGDRVTEGQLLAQLKDDVAKAMLATAEKEASSDVVLRFAVKARDLARVEYERMLKANQLKPNAVSQLEVDRGRLALEKAELEIEKAELDHQVLALKRDEAAAQLGTYRIEAPFAGVVTRVLLSRGATVRQGDVVLELVNTDRVRVEGAVPLADLDAFQQGALVSVQEMPDAAGRALEGRTFPGRIVFVDVTVRPVANTVRICAEVENPGNALRAGLEARMVVPRQPARK
jgi:RND family efflux transporter MFP subunit